MKLQYCVSGNVDDIDEKSECCYSYGNWDTYCSSCIGLIIENGMFEYRDIYTNKFIRYKIINTDNNNMIINKSWLHFIFINESEILFSFENDTNIYKTSYQAANNENKSIFPNIENINKKNLSFDIDLRFECSDIIKCFDIDLNCKYILCGLLNGNILIGSIDEKETDEEELILMEDCHSCEITAICGSVLNAFISSSADFTVKIWDFDDSDNTMKISQLYCIGDDIFSGTGGITLIYPFRSFLNNLELLSICTVEGIIFTFLFNNNYKLFNISNIKYQSEILDISTMNDGVILSISTLNGYIYLFDTINFKQISFEKISEKPIVFAKYKNNNNDFLIIDYNGMYKLYPQTRATNTECSTNEESHSNTNTNTNTNTPSVFTVDTPKNKRINTPTFFNSKSTISSTNTPFHAINHRKHKKKKEIINPLKTQSILNEMNKENKENIHPISSNYSMGKSSAISTFYKNKIKQVKNSKFDIKKNDKNGRKIMNDLQKKHLKRMVFEEERRKNMENSYGSLPTIPNKNDLIQKDLKKKEFKNKKNNDNDNQINNNNNNTHKYAIKPSLKPFISRSLEPERRRNINTNKTKKKEKLQLNNRKTISFTKKMTFWNKTTFNQQT